MTKNSAATTATGNLMAATDTGFEVRKTLDGVINSLVARERGQVNSVKSQQATTMQLNLVRPPYEGFNRAIIRRVIDIFPPLIEQICAPSEPGNYVLQWDLVTSSLSRLFPLKINCLKS